ncbi:MBL fold metallo-hydrolase [Pontimicrobium aquaticum]|uniref:MBL fold metallo-hydrolase n=1 Tax=Pontimicrobium aquaticum TaxID=2565367 RepID=A0A4U0F0R3_9FLAO|nr:MBL fold metallo-hydrolase [Pontimicrobium aquaticum]TJY37818.1 MBL fold metallo-hydrolase [Pontimicrobium aquaticum]
MKNKGYLILSILFFSIINIFSQNIKIKYLANEGVLIKSKSTQILIDALFKKEFDFLDVLPNSELDIIEKAKASYGSIDIVLATHLHGDHFNPHLVGNHLLNNKEAIFLAPEETVNYFKDDFKDFNQIVSRVKPSTPNLFKSQAITIKNVEIKVLRFEHFGDSPWKEAENVGYLISIEGKKILHLGDSKINIENLKNFNLQNENVDVAILPYWQLGADQQKDIIEKHIKPKQIFVAHIPIEDHIKARDVIKSIGYKNTFLLIDKFKTITIK